MYVEQVDPKIMTSSSFGSYNHEEIRIFSFCFDKNILSVGAIDPYGNKYHINPENF